jgi:lipopolysaccharide/colanic/teichoic acid biosynthesis glycosyltransferase
MREDAERKCGPVWASDNDPRITSVGRILRYTHLDELPQLYNIIKGDMSFVGPRPERPYFVNQLVEEIPGYAKRLNVKPGLTGLAQIKTGYDYSIESVKTKLHYDLEYCKNGNLVSYFKIMFVTIFKTVIGKAKI